MMSLGMFVRSRPLSVTSSLKAGSKEWQLARSATMAAVGLRPGVALH